MKTWKLSGIFLIATGIIHILVGIILNKEIYLKIVEDGVINSIQKDYKKGFALWFFLFGVMLIFLGEVMRRYIQTKNKPAPLFSGYFLLGLSVFGCLIVPMSGFWLLLIQATIILFAKREVRATATTIPTSSYVTKLFPVDYHDSFGYSAKLEKEIAPDDVMIQFWTDLPPWINFLFKLRNFLVKFIGLKGEDGTNEEFENSIRSGKSFNFVSVEEKNNHETVLLLTDKHLDGYISVYFENEGDFTKIYLITLVKFHNRLGKIYFFFIKPFHIVILKSMLNRIGAKLVRNK